jgi:hypothetical protein
VLSSSSWSGVFRVQRESLVARGVQDKLTGNMTKLTQNVSEPREMLHLVITEMREGFDHLIVGNEVTRKLAEDVGRLAITTS